MTEARKEKAVREQGPTAGAMRAARAQGHCSGPEHLRVCAEVIDRETGLPELVAALRLAQDLLVASGYGGSATLERVSAALDKAGR